MGFLSLEKAKRKFILGWDLLSRRSSSLLHPADYPRVLLIDKDNAFRNIIARIARQGGVTLTSCEKLEELGDLRPYHFDVAIVDYELGDTTGIEVAKYLDLSLSGVPVILIGKTHRVAEPMNEWPLGICGFIHKSLGCHAILEAAVAAYNSHPVAVASAH